MIPLVWQVCTRPLHCNGVDWLTLSLWPQCWLPGWEHWCTVWDTVFSSVWMDLSHTPMHPNRASSSSLSLYMSCSFHVSLSVSLPSFFLSSTFSQEPSKLLFPFFLPFFLFFRLLFFGLYALALKGSKGLNTKVFVMFGNDCPQRMWKASWKGKDIWGFLNPHTQTLHIKFVDRIHAKLKYTVCKYRKGHHCVCIKGKGLAKTHPF